MGTTSTAPQSLLSPSVSGHLHCGGASQASLGRPTATATTEWDTSTPGWARVCHGHRAVRGCARESAWLVPTVLGVKPNQQPPLSEPPNLLHQRRARRAQARLESLNPGDRCAPREGPGDTSFGHPVTQQCPRVCVLWRAGRGWPQLKPPPAAVPGAGAAASTPPLCLRTSLSALLGTRGWNNPLHPQTLHQRLLYAAFAVSVPSEPPCLPLAPCIPPSLRARLCLPSITSPNENPGLALKGSRAAPKSVQASMKTRGRFCAWGRQARGHSMSRAPFLLAFLFWSWDLFEVPEPLQGTHPGSPR